MSGHSKWSTIKRKKGAADAKKGKIFTRCIHEINIAVKEGGSGDPNSNPRLRIAVDKAKAVNMPNDNIDRAIKRATGEGKADERVELSYEGRGPAGIAVIVDVLTDNKNRTVSEIRHAFTRSGGALSDGGSIAWMFDKKGVIVIKHELITEEQLMEVALDNGADDVTDEGEVWEVVCEPTAFYSLRTALEKAVQLENAEIMMVPKSRVAVSGEDVEKVERLLEALEDLEDVLNVSTNCEFPG